MTSTAAGGRAAGGCTANLRSHLPLFVTFFQEVRLRVERWSQTSVAPSPPTHQEGHDSSDAANVITSRSNASSGHA